MRGKQQESLAGFQLRAPPSHVPRNPPSFLFFAFFYIDDRTSKEDREINSWKMCFTAGKVVLLNWPVYAGEIFFRFLPWLEKKNRENGAVVFPFTQAVEECCAQGAESPTEWLANVQVLPATQITSDCFLGFFFEGNQNKFACFTSIWPVTCANFMPQLGRTAPLNAPAAGWWCTVSWAGLSFWLVLDFCILN